jgi:hypothetical protein
MENISQEKQCPAISNRTETEHNSMWYHITVGFGVLTAVTMKITVFWDATLF